MRELSAAFQNAIDSGLFLPTFKLLAYNPDLDDYGAVVRGEAVQVPLDLTPWASSDIVASPTQLQFSLADPNADFHPDTGTYKDYLKSDAIIRLIEGDSRIDESEWMEIFTGQVRGQIGWRKMRASGDQGASLTLFSRESSQSWTRRKATSDEYSAGTDVGIMLRDLCTSIMGMESSEIRIPESIGLTFKHKVNQISAMTPWEAIKAMVETVAHVPYFDGAGKLAWYDKNLARVASRTMPDWVKVREFSVPENNQDLINKVVVKFLDHNLERIDGVSQILGTAETTTGFFSPGEEIECWWSDDRKQRADATYMKVIKSVNSGLLPVGSESYEQVDEFHGVITIDIAVWVPILATAMLLEYMTLGAWPDKTAPIESAGPVAFAVATVKQILPTPVAGFTIPWGRVLQAQALVGMLAIMMSIGSAQYEIWGVPYDMAYLEKESIAILDGIDYWEENELEIDNDFIGSYEQADAVAMIELTWQQSLGRQRKLQITSDPALELGDLYVLPDGRKFVITGISRKYHRGDVPVIELTGFKALKA